MVLRKRPLRSVVLAAGIATSLAAFAGPAAVASAAEIQSGCGSDATEDGLSSLAQAVNQAARASAGFTKSAKQLKLSGLDPYQTPGFAGIGSDQAPAQTTYDIKAAHETEGKSGIVPTVAWTDAEKQEMSAVEGKLPPCVLNLANIREQYRVQRGLKSSQSGVLGVAYSYNNNAAAGAMGGRLVIADLMFKDQVYKGLTGDQQMQAALGFRACFPPSGDANNSQNVRGRLAAMPPQLRKLNRERVLFHEYIHGVTHEQEGDGYSNPASTEGFFEKPSENCPTCGASRFDALRAKLFAPGNSTPESRTIADIRTQMGQIQAADPDARQKYCALQGQLSDFMKSQGVPQRWPGDMHSLDDRDEYITILIENAVYDPATALGPDSPYSAAEQKWVKDWWASTFSNAKFGDCSHGLADAPAPRGVKPAVSNAYSGDDPANLRGWFSF